MKIIEQISNSVTQFYAGFNSLLNTESLAGMIDLIFRDIVYLLLPIMVVALIQLLTNQDMRSLSLSTEWSFATIVIFGMSLTNFIELKVEYQHDLSYRMYLAARLVTFCLIVSVVVLSLIVLHEGGLYANEILLNIAQKGLLLLSFGIFIIAYLAKVETIHNKQKLPPSISKWQYYEYLEERVTNVYNELTYLTDAFSENKARQFLETHTSKSVYIKIAENRLKRNIQMVTEAYDIFIPAVKEFSSIIDDTNNSQAAKAHIAIVHETPLATPEVAETSLP